MEITYLWVDKGYVNGVGVTTDTQKIMHNIGKMDDDTQNFIALYLSTVNDEPIFKSIIILGRFICDFTYSKVDKTGKMIFADVGIKTRSEWESHYKKIGDTELKHFLERYDAAVVLSELEFDSFELSLNLR